jgi:uncharacterized protein (DUF1015 family)
MARLEPFAGTRYDEGRVVLGDVVAPPYDVVDGAARAELAARSPYNAILVELPVAGDDGSDPYEVAAQHYRDWLDAGVLARDPGRAFYVYRMGFVDHEGHERSTTGVVGALALDVDGTGDVLPHEQTMPKPKGDRLFLLRATGTNLSPIWGLSPVAGLTAACEAAVAGREPARAVDGGVVHEVWAVTDEAEQLAITELVATAPVLIADGHHRYETACAYASEGAGEPGDRDAVMAFVIELAEDQLFVRSIHRLVSGLPADFDLGAALAAHFEVGPGPEDVAQLGGAMAANGALGLVTTAGTRLLVPRAELDAAAGPALDSARLDVALADLPAHELTYQHGWSEPLAAVRSGVADAAFFLRPATVEQIADTAHSGRRMPPKTTFFEPKPRTGMVFRQLSPPWPPA